MRSSHIRVCVCIYERNAFLQLFKKTTARTYNTLMVGGGAALIICTR
jgi:hypothetical protein